MSKGSIEKIEDLGFDAFFETNRNNLKLGGFSIARVIAVHKGAYKVKSISGEYLAKITGKQIFDALSREDYPVVGDWVAITQLDDEQAVIRGVLPRKTIIKRKRGNKNEIQVIASNIDVAFVIESVDRDYNLNRLGRYLAIINDTGVQSAVILNKADLLSKEGLEIKLAEIRTRLPGIDVISTSTVTEEGMDELKSYIKKGKTYCFLGSSGVGKSSLINKLVGNNIIKTGDIGLTTGRGKHTTTRREMFFLKNGGLVIDNPGMREVGLTDVKESIDNIFDDIAALAKGCKYADCAHTHEPGCAVLAAVKSGKLDGGKYSNYVKLRKEAEFYEMSELEKKEKSRQFGRFIKKAKKDFRNYGHKDY